MYTVNMYLMLTLLLAHYEIYKLNNNKIYLDSPNKSSDILFMSTKYT